MIEATKAYKTADGKTHASLTEAKSHELESLLAAEVKEPQRIHVLEFVAIILERADKIIEILKTKERIRAKKGTGTRKPRKGNTQPELVK